MYPIINQNYSLYVLFRINFCRAKIETREVVQTRGKVTKPTIKVT